MRTNIDIDDELMKKVMVITGLKTKKDVVHKLMEDFVKDNSRLDIRDLIGQIQFSDGYDYKATRAGRYDFN